MTPGDRERAAPPARRARIGAPSRWIAWALCGLALLSGARTAFSGVIVPPATAAVGPGLHAGEIGSGAQAARGTAPTPRLLSARDAWLGLAAAGATSLVAANDRWFRERARASDSPEARSVARAAQPFGNAAVVAPAILLVFGAARLAHRDSLEHAAFRTGLSVGVAGGAALLLKELVGRSRPYEEPTRPYLFRPFSGHVSFPSGHAVVAFATATALTRESGSRWVPWVAFPAAAVVGWSRVHDDEHWTSDVVAGAAIGAFLSAKTESFLGRRPWLVRSLSAEPWAGGWRVTIVR